MKVSITCSTLRALVAAAMPAAATGETVTAGVHLEADDLGRLVATCTNYAMTIKAWAESDIGQEGVVVAPAALLAKALATLPDSSIVRLDSSDNGEHLRVEAGRACFNFNCRPAFEWPVDGLSIDGMASRRIDFAAKTLADGLAFTVPFTSTSGARPSICNVQIRIVSGLLTMTSTDGLRLSRYTAEGLDSGSNLLVLVPREAAAQILAALRRSSDAEPFFEVCGHNASIVIGNTQIRTRLDDSAFPNADKLFDKPKGLRCNCNRADLLDTVRRAAIMGKGDVKVANFDFDGKSLRVSANGVGGTGDAADELEIFRDQSESTARAIKVKLNPDFVIEALRVFPSESVAISAFDEFAQVTITADDWPGVHLMMPLRD